MKLKVIFRTDASLNIGTGHVMRCLTLADALRNQGVECHFICREHPGHLMNQIRVAGHEVHSLPPHQRWQPVVGASDVTMPAHAEWLGASQEQDAMACASILRALHPDWLVVDHYALDIRWETVQRPYCRKLVIIDDLADRRHDCDFLLDQTFGRREEDYQHLVPQKSVLLCGSRYALLRPEFAQWRPYSLARRKLPQLEHLLIALGGVDRINATGQILDALIAGCLPDKCRISVVMGETAPWLSQIQHKAAQLSWSTSVLIGVTDMARLMADSDLAIGAGGATSWERCCLGLPTLLVVVADNQLAVARNLEQFGAARIMSYGALDDGNFVTQHLRDLQGNPQAMASMTHAAASAVDGKGVERVMHVLCQGQ
ncbi:UDP-2,4-diacetamido-2,4,6-trideoxy-beta-L-altropyranose hydrolase [Castellaniella daejeonensis]